MAYNIDEGTGIIYELECKVNGRVYVGGFFSDNPDDPLLNQKRLAYHAMNAIQGKHKNELNTDIKNYGSDNFSMEVLEVVEGCTASQLRGIERSWVYELADKHGTYLYNKLPKSVVNEDTTQYTYEYIEGDYTEALEKDQVLSRNLYVITLASGQQVEVSGHTNYKKFIDQLEDKNYSVRRVLTEDIVDYLYGK